MMNFYYVGVNTAAKTLGQWMNHHNKYENSKFTFKMKMVEGRSLGLMGRKIMIHMNGLVH